MFESVLVANRGEIAVRIMATLSRLGIRSIAVYSDADSEARHVREADEALRLGPAAASESYLSIDRVLEAAARSGAQAIHPGYGFLSENAAFARSCQADGVVFIGPSAEAIEVMGDKIRAKLTVQAAGVPTVPGRTALAMSDDELVAAALDIGFPVIVKPSAGGGGKGMRLVESINQLAPALAGARREAVSSFGNDTLFIERFVVRPRHIEVQVLADEHGTTLHLGERECSLQRRHQKVIEEAPSIFLSAPTRARLCDLAVKTAEVVAYRGVGTVEFIVSTDAPEDFFFMEMNTRLQVEHPVTELVTGLDLVEQQLRVAAGERLNLTQDEIRLDGHAIEARIYAEDPAGGFLPTGGKVLLLGEPSGEGVRVDSSLVKGTEVGVNYDPMLAKVIVHGPDRATALARLDRALADTVVLGVTTNTTFLRALLANDDVRNGNLDTGLIDRDLARLITEPAAETLLEIGAVFALSRIIDFQTGGARVDRWDLRDGWRLGESAPLHWSVTAEDNSQLEINITGTPANARVTVGRFDRRGDFAALTFAALVGDDAGSSLNGLLVTLDGRSRRVLVTSAGDATWLWIDGYSHLLREHRRERRGADAAKSDGDLRSPMPGAVIDITVALGQSIDAGDRIVVIEAMKMEHVLIAPFLGRVTGINVSIGDQVAVDQVLVHIDHEVLDIGGVTDRDVDAEEES